MRDRLFGVATVLGLMGIAGSGCSSFTPATDAPDVSADAGSDAAPDAAPRPFRWVFVSSKKMNGALGGLIGADQFCKTLADAQPKLAGLHWYAWLSTEGADARVRFLNFAGAEIRRVDNATVFDATFPMASSNLPKVQIALDEAANPNADNPVWTGTTSDGVRDLEGTCESWNATSMDSARGGFGDPSHTDATWTASSGQYCSLNGQVYCFEVPVP